MLLSDKLKTLRKKTGLPQRKIAAKLDIDTATYCKFEKGILRPKRKHIIILCSLFGESEQELLKLWLADKITAIAKTENAVALDALKIVNDTFNTINQDSECNG